MRIIHTPAHTTCLLTFLQVQFAMYGSEYITQAIVRHKHVGAVISNYDYQ